MIKYETNSKLVKPGQTFVAIKGATFDGHDYIDDAIKNGATSLIVEHDVNTTVPYIVVNDVREYLKNKVIEEYSDYINDLNIVAVTGTNGKTTTCYLTYQMLNKLNIKTAYIGTIGFYYGDVKRELSNTTPDLLTLYNLLYEAKENGCTHVVMEVSSHSLEEERIAGLKFVCGAFTNLTQDHLDFHKTMENYLNAKLKIMNYIINNGNMIVNYDDDYSKYFVKDNINTLKLGYRDGSDLLIKDAHFTPINTDITFVLNGEEKHIRTNLTSKFNVYNYLTCLYILLSLGVSIDKVFEITPSIYPPKGRCEIIEVNKGVAVVDYAHTPDAVEKVITSFLELKNNKIITIVGCGGDRDPIKRPIMGDIACKLSDKVIFTNDNPRTEDPHKIMEDITKDLKYDNFKIIFDRKEAIETAINEMDNNDIILILGKGHEDYQIIGREKIHFDDCEIVKNWKNN